MSEDDFLSRWSRRKQAAAVEAKRVPEEPVAPPPDAPVEPPAEAFDVSTLPPVDSITAISDVRDFLRAGVPAELTRAALRRAWSADPAIRDFIGLAENSWDFTAPDSIPGFGPLNASPEEIRQLVDRIVNGTREVVQAAADEAEPPQNAAVPSPQPQVSTVGAPPQALSDYTETSVSQPIDEPERTVDIAMQYERSEDADSDKPRRPRTRGGALPQ